MKGSVIYLHDALKDHPIHHFIGIEAEPNARAHSRFRLSVGDNLNTSFASAGIYALLADYLARVSARRGWSDANVAELETRIVAEASQLMASAAIALEEATDGNRCFSCCIYNAEIPPRLIAEIQGTLKLR